MGIDVPPSVNMTDRPTDRQTDTQLLLSTRDSHDINDDNLSKLMQGERNGQAFCLWEEQKYVQNIA